MIKYTYEVIAVDEAARCMEIVFSSEGLQTIHVGSRLPYQGESLEQLVAAVAPVAYWLEQDRAVDSPTVGQSGMIDTTPPAPTLEQQQAEFTAAIQLRLDAFARTRNYDGILSACTYATSTVPKFNAEGQACVNLRDATWSAAYGILAQVQAGTRPMPASIADIDADLPSLGWPA